LVLFLILVSVGLDLGLDLGLGLGLGLGLFLFVLLCVLSYRTLPCPCTCLLQGLFSILLPLPPFSRENYGAAMRIRIQYSCLVLSEDAVPGLVCVCLVFVFVLSCLYCLVYMYCLDLSCIIALPLLVFHFLV
jgi:hypothetical protein